MLIGVPAERKVAERRVGLTPAGVSRLVSEGHTVRLETRSGLGSGYTDLDYERAGAEITHTAGAWDTELVVKVKEPVEPEYPLLGDGQILFCYLHLAAEPKLASTLASKGVTAIAYETVTSEDGGLPLLAPMSEIAGRLAGQQAAALLLSPNGGTGSLLGGSSGVMPCLVGVLGGGIAGQNAAKIALGLGARVRVLDKSVERLRELEPALGGRSEVVYSDPHTVRACVSECDVLITAALVPGGRAPLLVSREALAAMKPGAVICDIAIDQGGCCETSRPTTHEQPTYKVDSVVHYCVTNMPGAVPRTSTRALTNATLEYVVALATLGRDATKADPRLAAGLNVADGEIVHPSVVEALAAV